MSTLKVCSVEGCGGKHKAKGLCSKHYDRQYRETLSDGYVRGLHDLPADTPSEMIDVYRLITQIRREAGKQS